MKYIILITILSFTLPSFSQELTTVKSAYNHDQSVKKISDLIISKKLKIFNQIDHHTGAKKAGLSINPTTLILFGNPKVGTAFMKKNQQVGIDLPMKILIYTDKNGKTFVSYRKIDILIKNHSLKMNKKITTKVSGLFSKLIDSILQ